MYGFVLALIIIVSFVFLFLVTDICISVTNNGNLNVKAGLWTAFYTVYTTRDKKIKLKDFTPKKYRKKMASLEKGEDSENKKEKKQKKKADEKKESKGEKSVSDTVSMVLEMIDTLQKYTYNINTNIKRMNIAVGGKDASAAAIEYGVVSSLTGMMYAALDQRTNLKKNSKDRINISCDFERESIDIDVSVSVKIKMIYIIRAVIEILKTMISKKGKRITANN